MNTTTISPLFSPEELAELRKFDDEIDSTYDDIEDSQLEIDEYFDHLAILESFDAHHMDLEERRRAQEAYRKQFKEAERRNIDIQMKRLYQEAVNTHNDIFCADSLDDFQKFIILKWVMQDRRLTVTAKAIYAYFYAYACSKTLDLPTLPRLCRELKLGKNTYYNHFNLLKKLGYIKSEQMRNSGYTHSIYSLNNPIYALWPDKK